MWRFFIIAVIAAVIAAVVVVLAGCTRGGHDEDGGYRGDTTAYPEPTHRTTTNEEPSGSKPPKSALSFGERTVSGVLGSYCWTRTTGEEGKSVGLCVDAAGPPIPDEEQTLAVPEGSVMVFDYGGRRPTSVGAGAYKLWGGSRIGSEASGLRALRRGEQTEISAELPPGEYVVGVFVTVPEGDASYSFRVAVEGEAGELPNSGSPSTDLANFRERLPSRHLGD